MLLAEAGCLLTRFILCISGVQGQAMKICALKGSSVDLLCSADRPSSSINWYTVHQDGHNLVRNDFSGDGNRTTYNMSGENDFNLTITDLRESDAKSYCCGNMADSAGHCWSSRTDLSVTDLQVKVIPSTEGQTVTLMCSTSCPLTENPALYVWYKNGQFLYEDWSNWYQELVSSDKTVTYSCAIKGYEDLRAPEVSVDSVSSVCFNVTYAKGRMCSYTQTSEEEPCSITFPSEVYIQRTFLREDVFRLTCTPSCPLTDPQTAYKWYFKKRLYKYSESQNVIASSQSADVFCAVKGHVDLYSKVICTKEMTCSRVNYVSRRICAVEGSSVNISSEYFHPSHNQPHYKIWYKIKISSENVVEELEDAGRLEYHDNNFSHILRIKEVRTNDSAEYIFGLLNILERWKQPDPPGVTLVVTGLKVTISPSAVVTEGQRVTLICSTSCPLNTHHIWYLNSRSLTLSGSQTKVLVLDPVSGQHAGKYSCSVNIQEDISSPEVMLTVQARNKSMVMINAVRLLLMLLIPIPLLVFHLWISIRTYLTSTP